MSTNPYQSPDPAPAAPSSAIKPADVPRTAPRVWTVFVAYAAAAVGSVAVQIVAGISLAGWLMSHGTRPQELGEQLTQLLTTPLVFILLALSGQVVIALAAIIPARLSPEPALSRLGLVAPNLPAWAYPVVAVGALVPFAVGIGLAFLVSLVIEPDRSAAKLYEQMTLEMAAPFVLLIAVVPGFVEELFFRGYMQRRLLARWSPGWAILLSSSLFALLHVMPHAVAFALPLGVYLGVLAWRTGSIWPGMICHASINGTWNVWQITRKFAGLNELPPPAVMIAISAMGVACFLATVWIIARRPAEGEPPATQVLEDAVS